jgi:cyanophycinase-like exopeptidase
VRAANFVYLSGGRPAYLAETLAGTPVWDAILDVLARGGVVAGCSAGAMIFGAKVPHLPPPPIWVPAFALLPDVVIVPHFDEMGAMLVQIMHWVLGSGYTLLGIDGNTALVCADSSYTVAGRGGVTVWSAHKKVRYADGDAVVWP